VLLACRQDSVWRFPAEVDGTGDDGGVAVSAETADASPVGSPVAVVEQHNSPRRDGLFVTPGLTRGVAAGAHLATDFSGRFAGSVNAQPLYVPNGPDGGGAFYVVTESNDVLAFDEQSGERLWKQNLGLTATHEPGGCPIPANAGGITSTPYIDLPGRTLYTDSMFAEEDDDGDGGTASGRTLVSHRIHALSIDDGTERPGWPVDPQGLFSNGHPFLPEVALQRGALALVEGTLYVPYGSVGDCGNYRGTVVAIDVDDPAHVTAWAAPGPQAGIWSANGVSSDGENVFFATGNGGLSSPPEGASEPVWPGGEAAYRFSAGPLDTAADYYAAANWQALDESDIDVGASGVLLIDQPQSTPSELAIMLGKDGNLYLLDAKNMGSAIGAPIVFLGRVATRNIVDSPAAIPNAQGTLVVFEAQTNGVGYGCPRGESGNLVGVQIVAGAPPTAQVAWCAPAGGYGAPIITTTDGRQEAIVWLTASNAAYGGTGPLMAFDASNGALLFHSTTNMAGLSRFNTVIVADGRLVVGANNRLFSFEF
jgi:outer membrane protein assembly factor BamB